jgi:tetratricopeptide (TPR) repeat protein
MTDLEEAILLHREALELRPSPHPCRSHSLNNLGNALLDHYRGTDIMVDLEESISLHREALELRSFPHPDRSYSLYNLALSLQDMYEVTRVLSHLQEAITCYEGLLEFYHPVGHEDRVETLTGMADLLQMRFDRMGQVGDLSKIALLRAEADQLLALSTEPTT